MRALREVVLTARVLSGQAAFLGVLSATGWLVATLLVDNLPALAETPPLHLLAVVYPLLTMSFVGAHDIIAGGPLLLTLPVRWPARVVGVTLVAVTTQILLQGPLFLLTQVAPEAVASALLRVAQAIPENAPAFRVLVRDLVASRVVLGPTGPTLATLFAPHALARMTLHTAGAVSASALARGSSRASALSWFVGLAFGLLDLGGPELWRASIVLGLIVPLLAADTGVRWWQPTLDAFARPVRGVRPARTGWRAVADDVWESYAASFRAMGPATIVSLAVLVWLVARTEGLDVGIAIPWLALWVLPSSAAVLGWTLLFLAPLTMPAGASRVFPKAATRGSDLPGMPLLPMRRSRWVAGATLQGLVAPVAPVACATWALHRFAGKEVDGSAVAVTAFFATTVLIAQFMPAWRSPQRVGVHAALTVAVFFGAVVLADLSGTWVAMAAAGPPLVALFGLSGFAVLRGGR